jgi:hypothetical protein
MSRLIDADKIDFNEVFVGASEFAQDTRNAAQMLIDNQPTAFDVDKVIEQLEQRRANFDCKSCKYNDGENTICSEDCSDALIDDLIKIVKEGGLNERNSFQGKAD